jgi:peptide/nickel transport system permease protein
MMSVVRPLVIRALTLIGVLLAVLVLLVVTLGATGFSNGCLKPK